MTEKLYTAQEVKDMLGKSMSSFNRQMIALIKECAAHEKYKNLNGREALNSVALKLEKMEKESNHE